MKHKREMLCIALALAFAAMMLFTARSIAEGFDEKSVLKREDGSPVIILPEPPGFEDMEPLEFDNYTIGEENISYGAIIRRRWTLEKVVAIAENGSYMTEVLWEDPEMYNHYPTEHLKRLIAEDPYSSISYEELDSLTQEELVERVMELFSKDFSSIER